MIGWCIAGGVLLLFLLILLTPVVFSVNYDDFRDIFMWKVSWLGIPLLCSTGTGLFQRKKSRRNKQSRRKNKKEAGKTGRCQRKDAPQLGYVLESDTACAKGAASALEGHLYPKADNRRAGGAV